MQNDPHILHLPILQTWCFRGPYPLLYQTGSSIMVPGLLHAVQQCVPQLPDEIGVNLKDGYPKHRGKWCKKLRFFESMVPGRHPL
ncbi:hypothetical protein HAT93_00341 [Dickeya solani]|nr:hypothetical protein [Dickeya solani]